MDSIDRDAAGRAQRRRTAPRGVLAGCLLLAISGLIWVVWQRGHGASGGDGGAVSWPRSPWKNARLDVAYVGDAACARCHGEISETFRRHPMGRSLAPISSAPAVGGGDDPDGSTTFEAAGSRFTVDRRGGRMVHREARLDAEGRVLAQVEAVVAYALGSGTRGVSYLVERDGRLFESPISWYSQKRRWDISPGYEVENPHFDRPIEPGCLFCHANRVEPVEYAVNRYAEPIFRGHSIGCERCHGPGELHVRRPEWVDDRDPTIVNPKHLEPALRVAVCEQCHVLGTQRVERPGRSLFDYRPGLPTTAFVAIFGRAEEAGNKAVDHVTQMKVSRCFRESRGALDCTSCHDPHQVPAPAEKTAHFRQRCLACHEPDGCRLPGSVRLSRSPGDDCVGCHMPRAQSVDIAHTATTDHRIIRSPGAPPALPGVPDSAFPLVLLNGDGLAPAEIASLDRELAIATAAEGPRLPATPRTRRIGSMVLGVLDRVLSDRAGDLVARRMKAMVLDLTGRRGEAIRQVEMVLQAAPSYEKALDECLAYAVDAGDNETARAHARDAVAVNPWSAVFHERLAFASVNGGDWETALREAREALRIDPFLRFARMFVVECHLHRHEPGLAREEFDRLIGLFPGLRADLQRWFGDRRRRAGQ